MALEEATGLRLMDHQVAGIDWLSQRDRGLLADEPGLGKSAQLIRAAVEPVLILAPAMVLDSGTWDDEIDRWAPGIEATQVPYSNMIVRGERGRVTRGAFNVPQVTLKPELRRRWETVIADESHYLKGRKTSWTHAALQLRTPRLYQATGTPIPNWAHEAFMTLQLLYPEEAKPGKKYGSYWRWVKQWFEVSDSWYNPQAKEIGGLREDRDWDEFYSENWGASMLLRRRDECLDLPPLTQQEYRVKMSPEQGRIYRELKRDYVAWLDEARTQSIEAWSSAALMVKLCKVATGLEVIDPHAKPSGKLKVLASLLTDRPRPTLIVAHFRDSVEACARVARSVGQDVGVVHGGVPRSNRTTAIRAFQRGELDSLCATIDIISEGMTLHQGGADQVIRVERSWRPSKNEQVLRRLHRMGLERPVHAIDLISVGTYDERILRTLEAKTDEQMLALGLSDFKRFFK